MELGLAGMISGAGEGASKALTMGQAQIGASMLQEQRDKMDELRQQRLLDHQAKQGALTREAGAQEALLKRDADAANTDKTIAANANIHDKDNFTQKYVTDVNAQTHRETTANAKEMNAATNAMHLLTAKLQRTMQEKQFDKTFTQAKLSALKDTVRELGNEITRLSVVVSNPLADKSDPSHKAAVLQLESATKLHNLYAKQVGLEMDIDESKIDGAVNKAEKPAFKMPGAKTPGLIQAPASSSQEQEMMRRSIQ